MTPFDGVLLGMIAVLILVIGVSVITTWVRRRRARRHLRAVLKASVRPAR